MGSEVQVGEDDARRNEDEEFKGQLEVHDRRKTLGRHLLNFAWGVEVIAVLIGLFIAWSQVLSNADAVGDGAVLNTIISALPFFMVAVVEATKIPFVQAFYNTPSLFWRYAFGIVIIFLAAITFESASNGFERQYHQVTVQISTTLDKRQNIQDQLGDLRTEKERVTKLTQENIEATFTEARKQANISAKEASAPYISDRSAANAKTAGIASVERYKEQLEREQKEIDEEKELRNAELKRIDADIANIRATQVNVVQNRINTLTQGITRDQDQLRSLDDKESRDLRSIRGVFGASKRRDIVRRYQTQRQALQSSVSEQRKQLDALSSGMYTNPQIADLQRQKDLVNQSFNARKSSSDIKIARINKSIIDATSTTQDMVDQEVKAIQVVLDGIENRRANQERQAKRAYDDALKAFAGQTAAIADIDTKITALMVEETEVKKEINAKVQGNQIYRFAKRFYGAKQMADLGEDQVLTIAMWWFGSLAALVAFTGIFLALASEVVKDVRAMPTLPYKPTITGRDMLVPIRLFFAPLRILLQTLGKLVNSMRRFMVFMRKRRRAVETVEVVKEVPVDKVVFKEVAKEVVIRELVHVPMYTNDLSLINIQGVSSETNLLKPESEESKKSD